MWEARRPGRGETLAVPHLAESNKGNKIDVRVHNWGEPLPESERDRIFDKFYRGPNVRHQAAGTGMGLAIAREILIAHGGIIRVESTRESGTEFLMQFPYTPQDGSA